MRDICFHFVLSGLNEAFNGRWERGIVWALVSALMWTGSPGAQEDPAADPGDAEAYEAVLRDLEGARFDLNRASAEDLVALPWISEEAARRIDAFRKQGGAFARMEDLLPVAGISPEALDATRPYLSISPLQRISAQTRWRFTRPSGNPEGWDRLRIGHRTEFGISEGISGAFLTERDPGEAGMADFWSGYLVTSRIPGTGRVLLGDFRAGFGQGLLFSRQERTSTGLAWAGRGQSRRIGYRSTSENGAMRGLFVQGGIGPLAWTAMVSRAAWDAAVDGEGRAEVRSGGLHVSPTQRAHKDVLKEASAGMHLAWGMPWGVIGATVLQAGFSPPLAGPPSGIARNRLAGVDWTFRVRDLSLFGEAALSEGLEGAWIAGCRTRFQNVRLTALVRRYGPRFPSLRGTAFSAYSGPPQNEWGAFVGASWRPRRGARVEVSLDRHGRLRPTGGLPLPGRGERTTLTFSRRLASRFALDLTLGSRRETDRAGGRVGPRVRRRLRARLTCDRGRVRLRGWAEGVGGRTPARQGCGRAAGLDLRIGRGAGPALSLWVALFDVTAYEARIYTFEPEVWGGSRMQMLTGRGQSSGLRLVWGGRYARLAVRYSLKRTGEGTASSWALQMELGALR